MIVLGGRIPILGHLPGDIVIQRENVTIFIPLGTMLVVSVVASVVLAAAEPPLTCPAPPASRSSSRRPRTVRRAPGSAG